MNAICAGGAPASETSVVCLPTDAGESLLAVPGGSWKFVGEPEGRSEPDNASTNAVKSATSWLELTRKTGSDTKRSIESTLPSCRYPKPAVLTSCVALKPTLKYA